MGRPGERETELPVPQPKLALARYAGPPPRHLMRLDVIDANLFACFMSRGRVHRAMA
jgi:hypothetical protein